MATGPPQPSPPRSPACATEAPPTTWPMACWTTPRTSSATATPKPPGRPSRKPAASAGACAASPSWTAPTSSMSTASQVEYLLLRGHDDGDRRRGEPLGQLVERVVGSVRTVVEQHDLPGPGAFGQRDRVVGGGVPERRLGRHLLRQQLRVVHHYVGPRSQFDGGRVVLAPAVRARTQRGRAVIGDVGRHRMPVTDPVPERPAALVRDLARLHGEPAGLEFTG